MTIIIVGVSNAQSEQIKIQASKISTATGFSVESVESSIINFLGAVDIIDNGIKKLIEAIESFKIAVEEHKILINYKKIEILKYIKINYSKTCKRVLKLLIYKENTFHRKCDMQLKTFSNLRF